MKITIITATYNSASTITSNISSVNSQTYPSIEHIIIDGASKDDTLEIIKNIPNRITKIVSERDKGIYDALNKGVSLATGDIIGFLHSDDMLASPHTIENIVQAFNTPLGEKIAGPTIVYGDLIFVNRNDGNKMTRKWISEPFRQGLLQIGWMPPHPTIFMRREVYEKHGFFNINLRCSADYDFILRVFSDPTLTIAYIPEVVTIMRMGGMSTKSFKNIINKKKEDYWVLKHNNMPFPIWTLFLKNFLKIPQLFVKK